MEYLEHGIVFIVFVLALRYLFGVFSPDNESGCSKGCGNKCAVANLEKAMEAFEQDEHGLK